MQLRPIPDYADLMTFEEFKEACAFHLFTNDDGVGYYANTTEMGERVDCRNLKEGYTHVAWFNK